MVRWVGCGGWHGEGFEVTFLWMSDLVHVSERGWGLFTVLNFTDLSFSL
jgi:hypothetical protein